MPILFSNEILNSIKNELWKATSSVQIITAYCKGESFKYLNNCVNEQVKQKRLLVRFRLEDILNGSTDFSVLEIGLKNSWEVFIHFDLHAKTYIIDNKRGLTGSANVTKSGLSIGRSGNIEIDALVDIEPKDVEKIDKLFSDAIKVDNALIEKLKIQLENAKSQDKTEKHSWDASIMSLFNPHIDTLFSYELPEEDSISEGKYYSFIDETYDGNIDKLKESFRWSNAYLWLLNTLKENNGCLYFGELSSKLHNAVVSDPKPYRRDIKQMLANLLSLIEQLNLEDLIIDRPNYSQRIMLKNNKDK